MRQKMVPDRERPVAPQVYVFQRQPHCIQTYCQSMTRYFFHIRRGDTLIEDPEGQEFETLDDARTEATDAARDLVATAVRTGRPIDDDRIEICDEHNRCYATIRLTDVLPLRRSQP